MIRASFSKALIIWEFGRDFPQKPVAESLRPRSVKVPLKALFLCYYDSSIFTPQGRWKVSSPPFWWVLRDANFYPERWEKGIKSSFLVGVERCKFYPARWEKGIKSSPMRGGFRRGGETHGTANFSSSRSYFSCFTLSKGGRTGRCHYILLEERAQLKYEQRTDCQCHSCRGDDRLV